MRCPPSWLRVRMPLLKKRIRAHSDCDAVDGSSTGTRVPRIWGSFEAPTISEELSMQSISTIGLDIAKSVFQVHGVDAAGQVVLRRQLRRRCVWA